MQRFVEAEHKWKVGCTSLVVFLCAVQRLRIRLRLRESVVQTSVWVDKDSGWLFQRSSAAWPWYISYQWLRRDGCSQHRCQVFNVSLHLIVFFYIFEVSNWQTISFWGFPKWGDHWWIVLDSACMYGWGWQCAMEFCPILNCMCLRTCGLSLLFKAT